MVQLQSSQVSSVLKRLYSCAQVLQLQNSVESSCRPKAKYDATWEEVVYVQVQAWSSQSNGTNTMLHYTQGADTLSSMLSSGFFLEVAQIFQVFFLGKEVRDKKKEMKKKTFTNNCSEKEKKSLKVFFS